MDLINICAGLSNHLKMLKIKIDPLNSYVTLQKVKIK